MKICGIHYDQKKSICRYLQVLLLSLLRFFIFQQGKCDIFAEGLYPNLRSQHLSKFEGIRMSFDCTLSNKDWNLMEMIGNV